MDPNLRNTSDSRSLAGLFHQLTKLNLREQTLNQREEMDILQLRIHIDSGNIAACKSLLPSIKKLGQEMESIRDLRDSLRKVINIHSRPKIRPLDILDMPDEVLMRIFDHTKNETPSNELHFSFGPDQGDVESIKKARLTCRRFCRTSSHLLLRHVDVSMTESSIARFQEIAHHPSIPKGIRAIRLSAQFYSRALAEDIRHFAYRAFTKFRLTNRLLENLLSIDLTEFQFTREALVEAMEKSSRMADAWEEYANTLQTRDDEPSSRDVALLLRVHEQYKRRYDAQERLLKDGLFVQSFAMAMAKMPKANRIRIQDKIDKSYRGSRTDFLKQLRNGPDELINQELQELVDPLRYREARLHGVEHSPPELFIDLPVAVHRAGISLVEFVVDLPPLDGFASILGEGQLRRSLIEATDGLRVFEWNARHPRSSDDAERMDAFLSAVLSGNYIAKLGLGLPLLHYRHSQIRQGSLLTSRSWPNLKYLRLSYCHVHLADLQSFLNRLDNKIEISLKSFHLLTGSWADALDILRTKATNRSKLSRPGGAECANMSTENMEAIFKPIKEPKYVESKATRYIIGCEMSNPLRDEGGEVADTSHQVE